MTPDELLTTTRAVRKRLDLARHVSGSLLQECCKVATQAPTGTNLQAWHFVVVTDARKRAALAELYLRAWKWHRKSAYCRERLDPSDPVYTRMIDGTNYLAERLAEVPVHVVPCFEGRPESHPLALASAYGSIFPAVWSFMLAARARGLGTVLTTLHLLHEKEAAEVLGIPHEEVTQVGLIPVAHTIGRDFKPGPRKPLEEVLHWEAWGDRRSD